jgi:RNA polymerase sigma-70 factor (ECF subfamily)
LFRILRNTFINRYRAARVRPEEVDFAKLESSYEVMVEEDYLNAHQPPSPEKSVMDAVLDDEIQQAMARLPEEYRSVVIMALVEEMSYKEIASALSVPLGTVMSRLHRGRKLLQASLLEFARRKGILSSRADVAKESTGPNEGMNVD